MAEHKDILDTISDIVSGRIGDKIGIGDGPWHRRTITVTLHTPWLLGWSRWEVVTDLRLGNLPATRSVIASGRWKWRGRKATQQVRTVDANPYWHGPPIEVA